MIRINCDIGERGPNHPIDLELMEHIDIANIACGGHAGDEESIRVFRTLAMQRRVSVAAHLSYPDPKNFGRKSMDIDRALLLTEFDRQLARLPGVDTVKFHGALYNDSVKDEDLSEALGEWLHDHGISTVLAPPESCMESVCIRRKIHVLREGFAERNYAYNPTSRRLYLVDRSMEHAVLGDVDEAINHVRSIVERRSVNAYMETGSGSSERRLMPLSIDTICVHSDSPIALELVKRLRMLSE
jgi:5-oxoprolinase (ATP-hydrolysing) subunit A